jgi:hypothetical protein
VAELYGYNVVFTASLGFLVSAFVILVLAVRDPRRRAAA